MSVEESGEVASESVLEHHAERIGIDVDRLMWEAQADGIIVDSHADCIGTEVRRRFVLAGSLEEFCVYAERLAAND